jgi:hypothetical protein
LKNISVTIASEPNDKIPEVNNTQPNKNHRNLPRYCSMYTRKEPFTGLFILMLVIAPSTWDIIKPPNKNASITEGPASLIAKLEPRKKTDPIIPPIPIPAKLYAFKSFLDELFVLFMQSFCFKYITP